MLYVEHYPSSIFFRCSFEGLLTMEAIEKNVLDVLWHQKWFFRL